MIHEQSRRQCDWCTVNEQHCYGRLEYCNCDCTNSLMVDIGDKRDEFDRR